MLKSNQSHIPPLQLSWQVLSKPLVSSPLPPHWKTVPSRYTWTHSYESKYLAVEEPNDTPCTQDLGVTKSLSPCFISPSDTWVTSENHKVYMVSSDSFCTSCIHKGPGTMLHFCVFVQALPIRIYIHTLIQAHRSILVLKQADMPKDKIDNWWLEGVVWPSHPSSQCLSCPRSSPVAEIQVTNYPNSEQRKTN